MPKEIPQDLIWLVSDYCRVVSGDLLLQTYSQTRHFTEYAKENLEMFTELGIRSREVATRRRREGLT